MENKERANEIKAEIERLKAELKAYTGENQLDLKNRDLLTYPLVSREWTGLPAVEMRSPDITSLSLMARLILAPKVEKDKNGNRLTRAKKIKDLTREEYQAVCACIDEVIEVMDKHNKSLHPGGIAVGRYVEGMELYKPVRRPQIVRETKEVG